MRKGTTMKEPKKATKAKKPPKPAPIFRKPIPAKAFEKKYLRLVEQAKDREFLESAFRQEGGSFRLKEGLDLEALVRLNRLGKAIKGNRGLVKTGPLLLAAILGTGLAVFGLFFMNPSLERATERALEAVFGARAEVSGLRLDLGRLRIAMASVAVADRDEPMTNLFETGRLELRLDLASLVRGRVYVEEATAASVALGTARSVSGALPESPARPKAAKPAKAAAPPLLDFGNFDAKALLEREKAKLKSGAAYDEAGKAYAESAARWKGRAESSKKAVASLSSSSKAVLAIDPKAIKTAADAASAIAAVKALAGDAESVAKESGAVAAGLKSDSETAAGLEKAARKALAEDTAYLKSLVDPKSGAAREALEPSIREILSDKAERWLYYGARGLEVAGRLKAGSGSGKADKAGKKQAAPAPRGRDVVYPSAALPRFRLGLLSSSFVSGGSEWKLELRELSTEPDLVASPASLDFSVSDGSSLVAAKAVADLRGEKEDYSLDAKGEGLPLDLGSALESLGLGGFTGKASGRLELSGSKDGALRAKGGLDVAEARAAKPEGTLGEALAGAIASVDAVRLALAYERPAGGEGKLSLRTNLDELVAKAVEAVAARYAKQASASLDAALRDYAGKELEGKLASKGELDAALASAKGDEAAAASTRKSLDAKRASLEARAKEIGTAALGGLGGVTVPKLKP